MKKHNIHKELLEARINDALEGILDPSAIKQLEKDLAEHPQLLADWEQLKTDPQWSLDHIRPTTESFEDPASFKDPAFETKLRHLAKAVDARRHLPQKDLYNVTYRMFTRYALAASLTILAAMSLLRMQNEEPAAANPAMEITSTSPQEIQRYLYETDDIQPDAYYLSLFETQENGTDDL